MPVVFGQFDLCFSIWINTADIILSIFMNFVIFIIRKLNFVKYTNCGLNKLVGNDRRLLQAQNVWSTRKRSVIERYVFFIW